jgi:heme/copper-type cytochrome/quinol oxidase subunit 2
VRISQFPYKSPIQFALPALLAITWLMVPLQSKNTGPVESHFRIEASRFEYSPTTLRVNPGDIVTIDLVAMDVVHGFYLDSYDLELTADPGQTVQLTFVADKSGLFRFRCTVACGSLHPFMSGRLKVGNNVLLIKSSGLAIIIAITILWIYRKTAF